MNARDLDLLARAATFGTVDLSDLVAPAKRTARVSPTRLKRERAAFARLRALEVSGHLSGVALNSRFRITDKGLRALLDAGFKRNENSGGYYLRAGAPRPAWTL